MVHSSVALSIEGEHLLDDAHSLALLVSGALSALRVWSLCQRLPLHQKLLYHATLLSSRQHLPAPLRVCFRLHQALHAGAESGFGEKLHLWLHGRKNCLPQTVGHVSMRDEYTSSVNLFRLTTGTPTSLSIYCTCVGLVQTWSFDIKGTPAVASSRALPRSGDALGCVGSPKVVCASESQAHVIVSQRARPPPHQRTAPAVSQQSSGFFWMVGT